MDEERDGQVRITLKDVYQQTQSLERSLGDSLGALNLTLLGIRAHMEQLDSRNTAADELHREQSDRIRAAENVLSGANLATVLPDHEVRVRSLERFKYTLLGAVIVINGAAAYIEYLLTHHH